MTKEAIVKITRAAISEDLGKGDITSQITIPKSTSIKAEIVFKEPGIVCGLPVVKEVFKSLSPKIRFQVLIKEGKFVKKDKVIAVIEGPARAILTGERTALNFLGHLSGIATLTNQFVKKVKGTKVKVYDTRKTTPLLRDLEKYAVRTGGGVNHRMGLWDQVLIKENHIAAISKNKKTLDKIIKDARRKLRKKTLIEIEVQNLREQAVTKLVLLDSKKGFNEAQLMLIT